MAKFSYQKVLLIIFTFEIYNVNKINDISFFN